MRFQMSKLVKSSQYISQSVFWVPNCLFLWQPCQCSGKHCPFQLKERDLILFCSERGLWILSLVTYIVSAQGGDLLMISRRRINYRNTASKPWFNTHIALRQTKKTVNLSFYERNCKPCRNNLSRQFSKWNADMQTFIPKSECRVVFNRWSIGIYIAQILKQHIQLHIRTLKQHTKVSANDTFPFSFTLST